MRQMRTNLADRGVLIAPMRILLSVVLLLALGLGGCAASKSGLPPASPSTVGASGNQRLIITPDQSLVGRVVSVNENFRFVILNFPIGRLPFSDQRLNLYHRGIKTGEIRISGKPNDDNVAADILVGDAEVGDEAREN